MIYVKDEDGREAAPSFGMARDLVLSNLNELAGRHGYDIELTGNLDRPTDGNRLGKNAWASTFHPWDLGWDYALRARQGTAPPTQGMYEVIAAEIRLILGKCFDVIVKPHGTGAHFHIEYEIKRRFK